MSSIITLNEGPFLSFAAKSMKLKDVVWMQMKQLAVQITMFKKFTIIRSTAFMTDSHRTASYEMSNNEQLIAIQTRKPTV